MISPQLGVSLSALTAMVASGLGYQLGGRPGGYRRGTVLALKGGTTLIAAALALVAALWTNLPAAWWLVAGLCLCAVADVLLELKFEAGMLVFALGHVCYIAAFISRRGPTAVHIALFLALAAIALWVTRKLKKPLDGLYAPVSVYSMLILAMLTLSFGQPLPALIGAVLFVISDSLILYRLVRPAGRLNDAACILLYYCGQYLLALSAFFL